MLRVHLEQDRVILELNGRRRDVILTLTAAEKLEYALISAADAAESTVARIHMDERWGAVVAHQDRLVAIRFMPPTGSASNRVPMPARVALGLAREIKKARMKAAYSPVTAVTGEASWN